MCSCRKGGVLSAEPVKIVLLRVFWHKCWYWRITIHYDDGGHLISHKLNLKTALDWILKNW